MDQRVLNNENLQILVLGIFVLSYQLKDHHVPLQNENFFSYFLFINLFT